MKEVDVLIIGQGICGTFLSYYLQQEELTYAVIDDADPGTPSRIAAGIINPVTGRRLVTVWMVNEVLPFAWKAYNEIGDDLNIRAIHHRDLVDFFPSPFVREAFLEKIKTGDQYVHTYPEQNEFNPYFRYEFGCGQIRPVYTIDLGALLPAWRKQLIHQQALHEEKFELDALTIHDDGVEYKDIRARRIVFCDGTNSFENPYFKALPFAPNKGEFVTVRIPGLPDKFVYKKSMLLVPLPEADMFWLGASYDWNFEHTDPTPEFYKKCEAVLNDWIKGDWQIESHRAGMRPATLERRPFVGFHPLHPSIGILNGMGTKGCSLGPFFAKQLSEHIARDTPISKDADVKRFAKVLSRSQA